MRADRVWVHTGTFRRKMVALIELEKQRMAHAKDGGMGAVAE